MSTKDPDEIILQDWPLPDEWLAELGRIASIWGALESGLDLYNAKLAGFDVTDPRAYILLKHTSFPQKLDSLAALCEHLKAGYPWLADYKVPLGKIRAAQRLRNRYIHNGIDLDPATGEYHLAVGSARGQLKTSLERITISDLKRVSMTIHEALLALHQLVTKRAYPPMWSKGTV